jgi:hypothetical protein
MLSEKEYSISAPDVLSLASDIKSSSFSTSTIDTLVHPSDVLSHVGFYIDIDTFTGISRVTSAIFYRLGRLLRSRKASFQAGVKVHWVWNEFEVDADELQIRIVCRRQSLAIYQQNHRISLDLESYNNALLHTAHLIFLSYVRDQPTHSPNVESTVELVLEACASVSADSATGKLIVLPLYIAGLLCTKQVQKEFISNRLEKIRSGHHVTDVGRALAVLKHEWAQSMERSSRGESFVFAS